MPFPVTYLMDQPSPSETFVRRELEQLGDKNWPVFTRFLKGGSEALTFSLRSCPPALSWRFFRAASDRLSQEFTRSPVTACRILKRLPQVAHLIRTLAESDSQLIHAHFAGITADLAAIAARTLDLPWSCSVHAHDVFTCPPKLLSRRLRTATGITACSQQAADAVTGAGIPRERVTVIHHGLPLDDYPFVPGRPDDRIFFAGRLEPKKGLDSLLHACALLMNRGRRLTCVIAGAGSCLEDLKQLTEKLGLSQSVDFVGWQSQAETRALLLGATLLALPSRRLNDGDRDGIPNILLEALALGTPVVTTSASAASEVIADSANGLLVPPDDPTGLANALDAALSAKDLLGRIAKAGRMTAEELFDGSKNIAQLEAFFRRAVSQPQA